ncbi:MAG: MFS transporter [Nocardioides sp.]|uniref:MFS transporter n=1 Tax=Nocardioides sp. TaxID=35761 RepID=UPI0039E42B37
MTRTIAPETSPTPGSTEVRARHLGLALLTLAIGGFAIGTTEFVTMGLLPDIAAGVGVSIPQAGHVISAYALGVVVGAPLLAYFGAGLPRRSLLVGLMAVYALFNLVSALAPGFASLTVARFVDGLPHGGYFGVASLVAAELAPVGRKGRAVASVMLGLSVANVVGVPAATWLGQSLGWRWAYVSTAFLALVTVALVLWFVPRCPADPDSSGRRELSGFRSPQVWLTLLAGAIGFGGMFAVMSYVAPLVTDVAGLSHRAVPVFLLVFGLGMVFGTWTAGRLADWSVLRSLLASALGLALALLAFGLVIPYGWVAIGPAFAVTTIGSVLVVNLQLRLMDVAGHAQTLGAAMNHASLNVANALGAWLGGVVIAAGFGYVSTAYVGAVLSVAGFSVVLLSAMLALRARRAQWSR